MKQILVSAYLLVSNLVAGERAKRIINGLPLPSHDLYNTQFMVALVETHECISNQADHKLWDCQQDIKCGGSLISVDFVLTACHCMVYENWYAKNIKLPEFHASIPDDFPGIEVYGRLLNRRRKPKDPVVYRVHQIVRHALLNSMTIFAGHAEALRRAPQRRHAASFFPHHLCQARPEHYYPEDWRYRNYEYDVGLVKTCYSFEITNEVKLAPLPKYEDMERTINRIVRENQACLIAGWGTVLKPEHLWTPEEVVIGYAETDPEVLQHIFKYMDCIVSCGSRSRATTCSFCSHSHGPYVTALGNGDSGSPVNCNGVVVGLNVQGRFAFGKNYSSDVHFSIACVKDFITPEHLSFLKAKRNTIFHWIDGHPVTLGPRP